eukprot:gene2738-1723_t
MHNPTNERTHTHPETHKRVKPKASSNVTRSTQLITATPPTTIPTVSQLKYACPEVISSSKQMWGYKTTKSHQSKLQSTSKHRATPQLRFTRQSCPYPMSQNGLVRYTHINYASLCFTKHNLQNALYTLHNCKPRTPQCSPLEHKVAATSRITITPQNLNAVNHIKTPQLTIHHSQQIIHKPQTL